MEFEFVKNDEIKKLEKNADKDDIELEKWFENDIGNNSETKVDKESINSTKSDDEKENLSDCEDSNCLELSLEEINKCVNKDILKVVLEDEKLDIEYQKKVDTYLANNIRENEKSICLQKKPKRKLRFKYGDWVCLFCLNYNFSFRNRCNKCQKGKVENEKIFKNFEFSFQKKI